MCTFSSECGGRGPKTRLDSCFIFGRIIGLGFGGSGALPSLGKVTLDGFVGRRSVLGGVSVVQYGQSGVVDFIDCYKPS